MTAETLTKLIPEMQACTRCAELPLGPRPIFQLSETARILIVGQAPGRITHHKGVPFDDPSGNRLRDWMGIDRATFYDAAQIGIFPMGMCFPGTTKSGDLPPRVECAAWRAPVMAQLKNVKLLMVIGRYAIDWHLPELSKSSVTEAALKWPQTLPKSITLPHPSPRNARWLKSNTWFEQEALPALKARVASVLK